jgi:protein TonB
MTSEEKIRWVVFISASFLLHAAALAWLDLSGADNARLPAKLTVLLESRTESEGAEVGETPASAIRSRDLFRRPPLRVAKIEPAAKIERKPEIAKAETQPKRNAVMKEDKPEPRVEEKTVARAPENEEMREQEIETASTPAPAGALVPAAPENHISQRPSRVDSVAKVVAAEPAAAADGSSFITAEEQGQMLSLLHRAISREKRYPMLARRQRREGTATVSFSLSPSGDMDAVDLDRSSGFSVLDTAAVSAVSRVAPFAPARLFLSDVTRFTVDVTFKLK